MRLDRIEREEPVLVDIINCMANPELNDTHLSGKTVDVSEVARITKETKKSYDVVVEQSLAKSEETEKKMQEVLTRIRS